MTVQIIISPSGERLVVLPEATYDELLASAEDGEDRRAIETFRRRLAAGEEEFVPATLVDRIINGENRVKVWREHRGLSAKALADTAGIAPAFLSQIESGKRAGTVETIGKLASALRVSVEDLIMPALDAAYQRIEEALEREPGRSVAELATDLQLSENHVRGSCEWLEKEGRITKRPGRPARYNLAHPHSSSTR